jgi:HrpA-like RNA helicase
VSDLPIHAVLPDLLEALEEPGVAVLIAPPGAGKTTAVAPALLDETWCEGTVILLSPRRVAARAAAERMAETLGERAGETIGYLTRLDSKRSARTRVLVMTEAIFFVISIPISVSRSRSSAATWCARTCGSASCPRRSTASASPCCWAARR